MDFIEIDGKRYLNKNFVEKVEKMEDNKCFGLLMKDIYYPLCKSNSPDAYDKFEKYLSQFKK